jgi:phage tail-like protein
MDIKYIVHPDPPLSHRFGVFFFSGGASPGLSMIPKLIPTPLDFRFQKVSGISAELTTHTVREGGQNTYSHRLPENVSYGNLVLERGYAIGSSLVADFDMVFSMFRFYPMMVMVTLFHETGVPIGAWLYEKAYPVKWSVSPFNAQNSEVVMDTMELSYTRFQTLRI